MARNSYRDDDQDAFSASAGGDDLLGDDLFGGVFDEPAPPPKAPAAAPVSAPEPKAAKAAVTSAEASVPEGELAGKGVGEVAESVPAVEEPATAKPAKKPRKKKGTDEVAEVSGETLAAEISSSAPGTDSSPSIAQPSVQSSPSETPSVAPSLAATEAVLPTDPFQEIASPSPAPIPAPAPAPAATAASREKTPDGPLRSAPPRAAHTPDGYVVVARRYRPQTFGELVGQEAVRNSLCGAIEQGRVGHAFLFSGPRGTGKTSTARILAKALNCMENGPRPDPCGKCASCLSIASGSSLDVIEIDAASNTGVDNIRDLRSGVALAPFSRYKVYIIDEVHMLSTGAFNALLKTLEEPPGQVVFVLATTEIHKVPDTIVSRCQSFQFRRFSEGELTGQLGYILDTEMARRGVQVDPEDRRKILDLLARSADGGMRDAQVLLDQILVLATDRLDYESVRRFVGAVDTGRLDGFVGMIHDRRTSDLLEFVAELVDSGQDLETFTKSLVGECRNLLVLKAAPQSVGLVTGSPERLAECVTLAARLPVAFLVDLSEQAVALTEAMKTASNPRFLLELFVVRLSNIRPVDDLDRILKRIESLEGSLAQAGPASSGNAGRTRAELPSPEPVNPSQPPLSQSSVAQAAVPSPGTELPASPAPSASPEPAVAQVSPLPDHSSKPGAMDGLELRRRVLAWATEKASMAVRALDSCRFELRADLLRILIPRTNSYALSTLQRLESRGGLQELIQVLTGKPGRTQLVTVEEQDETPADSGSGSNSTRQVSDSATDRGSEGGEEYLAEDPVAEDSPDNQDSSQREWEDYHQTQTQVLRGAEALKVVSEHPDLNELLELVRSEVTIDESAVELRVDGRAA